MKNEEILEILLSSSHNDRYMGYSLFDSHNSRWPFEKLPKKLGFYLNQIIKRSPINFRRILGVKKSVNPKMLGLMAQVNGAMYMKEESEIYLDRLDSIYSLLIDVRSKSSGISWGYNYYWPKRSETDVPAYTPNVVVTCFIGRGAYYAYKATHDEKWKHLLEDIGRFLLNDINIYRGDDGVCFSYTTAQKDKVINVNMLVAEVLTYIDVISDNDIHNELVSDIIKFTSIHQNVDGSWWYSHGYSSNKVKKQLDFHQGYVLESLLRVSKHRKDLENSISGLIMSGDKFYREKILDVEKGIAYWRFPKKYPIDIHNQAEAIIWLSLTKNTSSAKVFVDYTMKHFWSRSKRYFYYQKYPLITNKTKYLRWSNGWMSVALLTFIEGDEVLI